MTALGYYPQRWQAANLAKSLTGAVLYEFADYDGNPVHLDFEARVEYVDAMEPRPWAVVF